MNDSAKNAISDSSFAIIIPIVFTNEGSENGVIEDVILNVENINRNEKSIFEPFAEIDLSRYIKGNISFFADDIENNLIYPTNIKGKETYVKPIVFIQSNRVKNFPFVSTKEGKYLISLYVKTSKKDYNKVYAFNLDFDKEVIEKLNSRSLIFKGRINFPYDSFKLF